ncbi:hypothetical protein ACFV1L_16485 [Kitasatospora sp. NPDC059646]|uniref:hypothetical protein n=1 Tax=Kitasatospora sp. NPDC059646 TaxID=3346893 RepID=UPI00367711CE
MEDRRSRVRAAAIRWAVLVTALLLLLVGAGYAAPGWSVAHGAGAPGTFTVTAEAVDCGRCVVEGTFTPDDPAGPALTAAHVMGRLPARLLGDRSPAVAYAGKVYPPGGGNAWQRGLAVAAAGLALFLFWLRLALRARRRRRRSVTL